MDYINPNLDLAQIESTLRGKGRVLIRDFFEPGVAQALAEAVDGIDWTLTYKDVEGVRRLTGEQLRSLSPQQRMQLTEGITHVARHEFQFSYFTSSLAESVQRGDTDLLSRCMRWMGDETFMQLMRRLSGIDDIARIYAQATMYSRGNFLVAHDDHVDSEGRRLAYVINLTRHWRPDWGGVLHFSGPDGDVEDSFFPHFNSMALFTVPQTHYVSYVAPFAMAERTAITGWLIAP
ncbi:2OG-Fe(II) oxygenase family protein [Pelomonas sp. KK5]|uniref:2OG-Fe(II) oxygenase n=1 Tax=Pelomonas sp. KK5 TaxID=1855730 RepID=UPI00097C1459|nr:2OG-Fe(II) oxygenase family protein [Pelomonas sp. KK5]